MPMPFCQRTKTTTTKLGFGGAFTEATALNYMSLSTDGQKAVIDL